MNQTASMKVVVFGASGMVGHGVLLEAVDAADVTEIVVIGRREAPVVHPKVRQVLHKDFTDFSTLPEGTFDDVAACFFCLGVSSAGMNEADYRVVSFDYPVAAAKAVLAHSPSAAFLYVTGAGTDSTGAGTTMWARVKGQAENALLALTPSSWMLRPGAVKPERGVVSATPWLRRMYIVMKPILPLFALISPGLVTSTTAIGKAMLNVVRQRPALRVLEGKDINALAR